MHLELEEGTWTLFITCITIIFLLCAFVLIRMSIIHKTKSFVWLIFSTIFQTGALILGLALFPQEEELGTMLSEENSLNLGIIGLSWAASMLFLLIGIWQISDKLLKNKSS